MKKNHKYRIALLMNAPWGTGSGTSGGDQRLLQIFSRLKTKFEIDIYTTPGGKKTLKKLIPNAKYFLTSLSYDKYGVFISYHLRSVWVSREIIRRKYDFVYSGSDFFPDVIPAYKYRRLNSSSRWIQCIFHIYPNWRKRPGNKLVSFVGVKIQNYSFRKIRRLADQVININLQVREDLIKKWQFQKDKIAINPCGIDLSYFENIKVRKKKNQAVFLARLSPSKGIFELVPIWSKVVEKIPDAQLKIVGSGREKIVEKLQKQIAEFGLEKNCQLLGFLSDDKAYSTIKESLLMVFPSHEEGFGLSIAEALACGTPAVVWDLPVYSDVFPGGVIQIPENNIQEFAQQVIILLSEKKKRSKLVFEGLSVVKKYSWDEIAMKELRVIESLLK